MKELRFYNSRWKMILLAFGGYAFVAMGIWILVQKEDKPWMAWFGIVLFGSCGLIGTHQFFDRRPKIIINEIGIYCRSLHKDFINWEIINNAYLIKMNNQKFIALVVDESFEPSKKKGKWYKKAAEFSKNLGFQELNLSVGMLDVNAKDLTRFILVMLKIPANKRSKSIHLALQEGIAKV